MINFSLEGIVLRVVSWVVVWNLIGSSWHWLPHLLATWIVGDIIAILVVRLLISLMMPKSGAAPQIPRDRRQQDS